MRAVLDTNVFISGIFWPGASRRTMDYWSEGRYALVASVETILELETTLKDFKIRMHDDQVAFWVELVRSKGVIAEPDEKITECIDPDDDIFLEAAVAGGADYLVTQDNHLLKMETFRGIKILRPEEFNGLFV